MSWESNNRSMQVGFKGKNVMGRDNVTWFYLGKENKSGIHFTQKSKKDKVLYENTYYVKISSI